MTLFFYFFVYLSVWLYFFFYLTSPFSAKFWPYYLYHLAEQQKKVIFNRIPIDQILAKTKDIEAKEKLEIILEARDFARKLYQLEKVKSFSEFVDLQRNTLGWNITATEEFSLDAIEWHFPFIGKFGYLGFFNYELALKKAQELKQRNYDIYLSEISGYSTLGFFPDPIFNVYLSYPKNYLVRMVLHELAHEKLYFRDDSFFSESLASFIEKVAAQRFWKAKQKPIPAIPQKKWHEQYQKFISLVEKTKNELRKLYESPLETSQKRTLKKKIFYQLQKKLKNSQKELYLVPQVSYLAQLPELNNAILLQFQRYSPHYESFQLLLEEVKGDIPNWFDQLSLLKNCQSSRKIFLQEKTTLKEALNSCTKLSF